MSRLINGNDNHKPDLVSDENIIALPTLADRDRLRREKEKQDRKSAGKNEPFINMPPVTLFLLVVVVGLYLLTGVILSPEESDWIIGQFGFVPERFNTGDYSFYTLVSPISHMFLHGSWTHVVMNGFMLAAFGSGIERWLGSRRMLALFLLSGLCGAGAHYLLNTSSEFPMIGASGGLSGLFAGALIMLSRGQREMGGRLGILPFALLWIGLSIGFGMLGGPDGSAIAWAAHVGGFLGGFVILKAMRV